MSFKVTDRNGYSTYVNGNSHGVKTYKQLERVALDNAERCGGVAYYEYWEFNFQKDGANLFPRWLPIGEETPKEYTKLADKYKLVKKLKSILKELEE